MPADRQIDVLVIGSGASGLPAVSASRAGARVTLAAALETTQIDESEEVAWEEPMPECLSKLRVKDFGPLPSRSTRTEARSTNDVQADAMKRLEDLYARP